MKIKKVLNNNTILAFNHEGNEVMLYGKGIGFQKKSDDIVPETLNYQVFTLEKEEVIYRFEQLLEEIPENIILLSEEIIQLIKKELGKPISENIYITLMDHIHFAIERYELGHDIKNGLYHEIKNFYPDEYQIGKKSIRRINEALNIGLSDNEASFIALHIVNAELNEDMTQMLQITKIIQNIINIVKYYFKVIMPEETIGYYRFVTHLKFFAQRLLNGEQYESEDIHLFNMIKEEFEDYYNCAIRINEYLQRTYSRALSKDEITYITIHIRRIMLNLKKEKNNGLQ